MVSVDVKHHVYFRTVTSTFTQLLSSDGGPRSLRSLWIGARGLDELFISSFLTPLHPFIHPSLSPSLISLMVSVDVNLHVYFIAGPFGRFGLSVITVERESVKQFCTK